MMDDHEYHDHLLNLERLFIERVNDAVIIRLYQSARAGDQEAWTQLTLIAKDGWPNPQQATQHQIKADRALEILYMLKMSTQ